MKRYAEIHITLTMIIDGYENERLSWMTNQYRIDVQSLDFASPKVGATEISKAIHGKLVPLV